MRIGVSSGSTTSTAVSVVSVRAEAGHDHHRHTAINTTAIRRCSTEHSARVRHTLPRLYTQVVGGPSAARAIAATPSRSPSPPPPSSPSGDTPHKIQQELVTHHTSRRHPPTDGIQATELKSHLPRSHSRSRLHGDLCYCTLTTEGTAARPQCCIAEHGDMDGEGEREAAYQVSGAAWVVGPRAWSECRPRQSRTCVCDGGDGREDRGEQGEGMTTAKARALSRL